MTKWKIESETDWTTVHIKNGTRDITDIITEAIVIRTEEVLKFKITKVIGNRHITEIIPIKNLKIEFEEY